MAIPVGNGDDVGCVVGSNNQVIMNSAGEIATTTSSTTTLAPSAITRGDQQQQYMVSSGHQYVTSTPSFVTNNTASSQSYVVNSSNLLSSLTSPITTSQSFINPLVTYSDKNNGKKIQVGSELSKVVQNTQLFKALQPDSSSIKLSTSSANIGSLGSDGSVIIGCQSFKPTSTGYGINKAQIVPVNSIVSNNSLNLLPVTVSSLVSQAPISSSIKINENTYNNAFNSSLNTSSNRSITSNSKIQPSCSGVVVSSKPRKNSRSKKSKKCVDEELLLLQPVVVSAAVSSLNGGVVPGKASLHRTQNHLKSPTQQKEILLPASSPVAAGTHNKTITTNIIPNGFSLPVYNSSLESPSKVMAQPRCVSAVISLGGSSMSAQPAVTVTTPFTSSLSAAPAANQTSLLSVTAGGVVVSPSNCKQNIKQVFITPANQEVSR